ncbi:nucleotidyltransferase domain-containing protein [Pseudonocardia sp. GCM10023141]|uniref:nucleotidyltransferase domain-containing protein n=1 Tax=Pseudonocardia sp. GCM10023141 TaxID=3252653 RepID=UPI003621FC62
MKRDRATALLVEMLRRLDAGGSWQLDVVEEVHLFGSYARGALEPQDVDVMVDFDHHRAEWKEHFHSTFGYGRDPNATLRMALRGHTRSLSIEFGREAHGDIPMTPLWRRGDPIEQAIDRVHAIVSDPVATRAPRDAMPEYLLSSGDRIPRHLRQDLVTLVDGGAIDVTAVVLAAHVPTATWFDELIDDRWSPTSPLRRTALAVLAHWEERGVDLTGVHLHGKDLDVDSPSTPYFAGFGLRYFPALRRCFTDNDGEEWIEVVSPSLRGPVQALVVRQGPRFATFDWSVPSSSYFP